MGSGEGSGAHIGSYGVRISVNFTQLVSDNDACNVHIALVKVTLWQLHVLLLQNIV